MSDSGTAPAAAVQPDRAVPARLDPAGTGRILRLLQTLFAYGWNLVGTLRQERDPDDLPCYALLTSIFGTTNPALITVTIIRGLLRLAALRARLRKSVSFPPLPVQQNPAAATRIDRATGPRPRGLHAAGWAVPPGWPAGDQFFDQVPSPEEEMFAEIVAEDQDRPIGPILLDICLDLGIAPVLVDPATWDELRLALTLYGVDPATLEARRTPDLIRGHAAIGTPGPNSKPPVASGTQTAPSPCGRGLGEGAGPVTRGRVHTPQKTHGAGRRG